MCVSLETFSSTEGRVGNGATTDERREPVAKAEKQIFANTYSWTSKHFRMRA